MTGFSGRAVIIWPSINEPSSDEPIEVRASKMAAEAISNGARKVWVVPRRYWGNEEQVFFGRRSRLHSIGSRADGVRGLQRGCQYPRDRGCEEHPAAVPTCFREGDSLALVIASPPTPQGKASAGLTLRSVADSETGRRSGPNWSWIRPPMRWFAACSTWRCAAPRPSTIAKALNADGVQSPLGGEVAEGHHLPHALQRGVHGNARVGARGRRATCLQCMSRTPSRPSSRSRSSGGLPTCWALARQGTCTRGESPARTC